MTCSNCCSVPRIYFLSFIPQKKPLPPPPINLLLLQKPRTWKWKKKFCRSHWICHCVKYFSRWRYIREWSDFQFYFVEWRTEGGGVWAGAEGPHGPASPRQPRGRTAQHRGHPPTPTGGWVPSSVKLVWGGGKSREGQSFLNRRRSSFSFN